ncbi:hypothetical protein CC80DRAFT_132470 [Byssothecium circinans]|uniref:Uncharacterized protein n=1 Tax=Byssothecium circinans TaxID=147558 RepID=A0A6A5TMD8_9PLEO|nr:hypothetical protein CC80DRAFT_132470 [Byssothecium circinans]
MSAGQAQGSLEAEVADGYFLARESAGAMQQHGVSEAVALSHSRTPVSPVPLSPLYSSNIFIHLGSEQMHSYLHIRSLPLHCERCLDMQCSHVPRCIKTVNRSTKVASIPLLDPNAANGLYIHLWRIKHCATCVEARLPLLAACCMLHAAYQPSSPLQTQSASIIIPARMQRIYPLLHTHSAPEYTASF